MNTTSIVLTVIAIAALVLIVLWRLGYFDKLLNRHNLGDGIDWGSRSVGYVRTSKRRHRISNLGITIYSENIIDDALLVEVDRAYEDETRRARTEGGYGAIMAPTSIDIYLPADGCVLSPVYKAPSFKLRADASWDGSLYDQHYSKRFNPPRTITENGTQVVLHSERDGVAVIFAAEMLAGLSTPGSIPPRDAAVVCPGLLYEGTRNFLQHALIAHNDASWFWATNGPSHSHPISYRPLSRLLGASTVTMANGRVTAPDGTQRIVATENH